MQPPAWLHRRIEKWRKRPADDRSRDRETCLSVRVIYLTSLRKEKLRSVSRTPRRSRLRHVLSVSHLFSLSLSLSLFTPARFTLLSLRSRFLFSSGSSLACALTLFPLGNEGCRCERERKGEKAPPTCCGKLELKELSASEIPAKLTDVLALMNNVSF